MYESINENYILYYVTLSHIEVNILAGRAANNLKLIMCANNIFYINLLLYLIGMKVPEIFHKRVFIHLPILLVSNVGVYFLSSKLDLFERLHTFVIEHEGYEFDEIIIMGLYSMVYLLFLTIAIAISLSKKNRIICELSDKLKKEIKTKNRFHSIIAHDLKTPFNALIGFTDLLLLKPELSETDKGKDIVNSINKTSKNTYKLLENLLEWSRLQNGDIKSNRKNINLHDIISEELLVLESSLQKKELGLKSNVNVNSVVYVDENMLKFVVRNLLANAVKYSYPKGEIEISAKSKGQSIVFVVSDKGIGMTEEQTKNLFSDLFETTRGTLNEKGTGLGLNVCKEFIKINGGELKCESKIGEGTTFSFSLPKGRAAN